jgi:DNA-binding LacI/PurR family transcriptional regulator/DNA-binding transcriptional regulator YhcF (GntR family)
MKTHAFLKLADAIEQWLRSNPGHSPPSIREAAEQWHVSYRTAWKAFQELVRKGAVASKPGASMMRVAHGQPVVAARKFAAIYDRLRARILDGTYQTGKPFPKIDYFALHEAASRPTVSLAFSRLERENLAHRAKNRWVAGPALQPGAATGGIPPGHDAPVVLFLAQHAQSLSEFLAESYTNRFTFPFCNEIARHGIQGLPAVRSKSPGEVVTIPVGIEEVRGKIRSLKNRYRGALIVCIYPEMEKIGDWIRMLAGSGKPVIWFDYAAMGADCTRSRLSVGKQYFRMYQDESAAIRLALDTLTQSGHLDIGIHGANQFGWAARRAERLRSHAAEISPRGPRIFLSAGPAEKHWQFSRHFHIHEIISSTAGAAPRSDDGGPAPGHPAMAKSLIEKTPSLANLLRDHAPTALIALNDYMAREYYYWFTALGIRIPLDISMVSFDNLPAWTFSPVSTIDWGFERLGYQAAHIMINDLPVRADREGGIPGSCTLIHRGSIGKPVNSRRMLSLLGLS